MDYAKGLIGWVGTGFGLFAKPSEALKQEVPILKQPETKPEQTNTECAVEVKDTSKVPDAKEAQWIVVEKDNEGVTDKPLTYAAAAKDETKMVVESNDGTPRKDATPTPAGSKAVSPTKRATSTPQVRLHLQRTITVRKTRMRMTAMRLKDILPRKILEGRNHTRCVYNGGDGTTIMVYEI